MASSSDMSSPLSGGAGSSSRGVAAGSLGPGSVLLLSSLFELASSASLCLSQSCGGSRPFALSVGALSCLAVTAVLALALRLPLPIRTPPTLPASLTLLLLLWWMLGTLVLTFIGPFTQVGNGYLSTWGAFFASIAAALPHHPPLALAVDTFAQLVRGEFGLVVLLAISSTIMWIQAACCYSYSRSGVAAWALAVGLLSALGCAALVHAHQLIAQQARPISIALLGWWLQGLVITFIHNEFSASLNGFLSTWACIILSGVLFSSASGEGSMSAAVLSGIGGRAASRQTYSSVSPSAEGSDGYVSYGRGAPPGPTVGGGYEERTRITESADAYFAAGGE